jgi:AraC-like DNA-binding protein
MIIYIKNMVSKRCIMVVEAQLTGLGLHFTNLELGSVNITEDLSDAQRDRIRSDLLQVGLELMDDAKSKLIEKIKMLIIEKVCYSQEPLPTNLSVYLSQQLQHSYTYMANIFSEAQGNSIERFVIGQKIERVKELLIYDKFTLAEIAYRMHYSSVSHLSSQFKKITGLTASRYRRLHQRSPSTNATI